jgi:hypothetical protein
VRHVALSFALVLCMTACAALQPLADLMPTTADHVLKYAQEVCELPASERRELLDELNETAAPNRVAITCAR